MLAKTLRRLSADFEARWRHPVVAVETFTDPARRFGTCRKPSNFTLVGTTSGFGRRAGRFVYHGESNAYWLRPLRRDALGLLSSDFDPPERLGGIRTGRADLDRVYLVVNAWVAAQVVSGRLRHQGAVGIDLSAMVEDDERNDVSGDDDDADADAEGGGEPDPVEPRRAPRSPGAVPA
ncbi:MAG: hypothetical protein ACP5P1_11285 [Acidimicrobiales bacterium]